MLEIKRPGSAYPFSPMRVLSDDRFKWDSNRINISKVTKDQTYTFETNLEPLYKKQKDGKWQTMRIWFEITGGQALLCSSVETPGQKTKTGRSVIKRVKSKKYPTVIMERCLAKHLKKQRREGWVLDKSDVILGVPMLFHDYNEHGHRLGWPRLLSYMLDGIRCTYKANLGKFFSRKRNEFHLSHLREQMEILGISVDGELWHPEWSLEDIISVVKGDDEERKRELQYWIFDRPQGGSYVERMAKAMEIHARLKDQLPNINFVAQVICHNDDEVETYASIISKQPGVKGVALRNVNYKYKWDVRSYDVQGLKPVERKGE